jgi:hypothetical protein
LLSFVVVTEPRELRGLAYVEAAAIIAIAVVPWPELVPVALPLVIAATVARYVRRRGWAEVARIHSAQLVVGVIAGLVALTLALIGGAPVVEAIGQRAIEWSAFPIVRGNASQLLVVSMIVVVTAIAAELALRGWIVERAAELTRGGWAVPIACGALAEALITPGDVAVRLGAACLGAGLGAIYLAAGRTVMPSICARAAFGLGAAVLEALQVIG